MLFPVYNSLTVSTNEECMKSAYMAVGFTTFVYISIGLLGLCFFGSAI